MELNKPDWLIQMEGIFETLNEGVIISDDCHHILFANENALRLIGVTAEQVLGRNVVQFYPPSDADFVKQQIEKGLAQGENRYEFYVPRKDGARVPVIISSRVIEDPDGRTFAVVSFTDISHLKHAEEKLRTANKKLEKHAEEIQRDLDLASRVQQSLAPQGIRWGNMFVETFYAPVLTIGGDFGLVTPLGDEHLNLLVCDVTGHGISSALIANRIYAETSNLLERRADLGEMLRRLNSFVVKQIAADAFFFTMAIARLDKSGRKMDFAGAGHPPAFWMGGKECRQLSSRSAVLGCLENAVDENPKEQIALSKGDRIVLYTDGFDEVFDKRGEQLGVDGLQEIVRESAGKPFSDMKQNIVDRVEAWRHGPITDDRSLVLVEVS